MEKKRNSIIIILLLIILFLFGYIFISKNDKQKTEDDVQTLEMTQSDYVKPEEPVDRSQNVTLPGWGGFTIPANTKEITKGFELHNPAENFWYEDHISINDTEIESLVVDSGVKVDLNHYLALANIRSNVKNVLSYDNECFNVENNTLEAIHSFKGKKKIEVETEDGETVEIRITCKDECYYMKFGFYLADNDELLYQSGLVAPGKYIQSMEMTKALKPGVYEAYVKLQPYRSDRKTETNQGVVRLTLTVQ